MANIIKLALENFTITMLIIGLVHAGLSLWQSPRDSLRGASRKINRSTIIEAVFSYFILYSIGVSYFYNFVMHVFFGEAIAKFIGWADSPFQAEVGFASLGFAVVGLLAFRGSFDLRLAAVVGPACFLWGAAAGHIVQIIQSGNFAPGNAGTILYTDILLPLIGFIFLWLQRRYLLVANGKVNHKTID